MSNPADEKNPRSLPSSPYEASGLFAILKRMQNSLATFDWLRIHVIVQCILSCSDMGSSAA